MDDIPQNRKTFLLPITLTFGLLLLIAVAILASRPQSASDPLQEDLLLHYTFDEVADRIPNASGQGMTGTVASGTLSLRDGVIGTAAVFDGATKIETPLTLTGTTSISVWFNRAESQGRPVILGAGHASTEGTFEGVNIYASIDANRRPTADISYGAGESSRVQGNTHGDDTWHHLVLTFSPIEAHLYIDGTIENHGVVTGHVPYDCPLVIGDLCAPAARLTELYEGLLDDLRIYNRVLTPEEITSLYELRS